MNFDDSAIEKCYFYDITVSCYEPYTCETVYLKENFDDVEYETIDDLEASNLYKKCA